MIQSILLATDGSDSAERAADFAASLALRYRAKVTILHAYTPEPSSFGKYTAQGSVAYKTSEDAKSLVGNIAARLRMMGATNLETEVVAGPPSNVILGFAETINPDLIVVGARGQSIWKGALLGSVSMAVTQRAEAPVLVVK